MDRRLSTLLFILATCCIISLSGWNALAQDPPPPKPITATSIADLNDILALTTQPPRNLLANDTVRFTMEVDAQAPPPNILSAPYIAVSNEAMKGTAAALGYNLYVTKSGQGLWRLDLVTLKDENGSLILSPNYSQPIQLANQSNLSATTTNHFTVSNGTLELMRGSSITLQGTPANDQLLFIMGNGTTLNARGFWLNPTFDENGNLRVNASGNLVTERVDNFIDAANIRLQDNVTLGFDLTNYTAGQPVLDLRGNVTLSSPMNDGKLNLLGFGNTGQSGTINVQLLRYNYTGTAPEQGAIPTYAAPPIRIIDMSGTSGKTDTYGINFPVTVRGENWNDVISVNGRLAGNLVQTPTSPPAGVESKTVNISIQNFQSYVGEVTWTGSANNNRWDATSANWSGYITNYGNTERFLHGDVVSFQDNGSGVVSITVQNGGVQIGDFGQYNVGTYAKTGLGMIVDGGSYQFTNESNSLIGIDGAGGVYITTLTENLPTKTSVTFNSANSYWGGTTVDNAYLTLGNTGGVGTGGLVLDNTAELTFETSVEDDRFFNTISTEAGTKIFKNNPNTLTIYGTVSGGADTTVRAGRLQKNIGQGVLTVFKGAVYDTLDADRNIAGLSDRLSNDDEPPDSPDAKVELQNYKLYINVVAGREYVFSGQIIGNTFGDGDQVIKLGQGTQVFANINNTYSGGTEINAGTLVGRHVFDQNDNENATDHEITFRPFGTGTINIGQENSVSVKNDIENIDAALLQFHLTRDTVGDFNRNPPLLPLEPYDPDKTYDSTDPSTYQFIATVDNTITGTGSLELRGNGLYSTPDGSTEILYLTANNSTYTGKSSINGGKIRIGSVNSTGKTSEVAIAGNSNNPLLNSALQFNVTDSSKTNPYNRIITGAGNVEVLEYTNVFVRGSNDDQPNQFSGYTGNTFVEESSELHLLDVHATGQTNIVDLKTNLSELYLDFASLTDERGQEIDQIYDRFISGNGNLIKTDAGTAVLELEQRSPERPNNYTGTTTVANGTLKLKYADATGTPDELGEQRVEVRRDIEGTGILELAFEGNYNKGIGGDGILAKSESGTTTFLQGISTYTGGTYIYSGTLSYSNLDEGTAGNLGTGDVNFKRGGGTLQNRNIVDAFGQKIIIDGGSTATFDTSADLTVTGHNGIAHGNIDPADPYYNADDPLSHLVKTGDAVMTINTQAAWNGATTVQNGVLVNNIPIDTVLTVETTDSIYRTGNADRQVTAILGNGTVEMAGNYKFTVNNAEDDVFDGVFTGSGNLVKKNTGTLTLNGHNFYNGATIIENGIVVGNISQGTDLTVYSSGQYQSGSSSRSISSLQGNGLVEMQGGTLLINQNKTGFSPFFNGTIRNAKQFIKNGDGLQGLGGLQNKFSGDILVNGGTLQIGGWGSATTQLITNTNMNVSEKATLSLQPLATIEVKEKLTIDGTLSVMLGNNSIHAGNVSLGENSILNVQGIVTNDTLSLLMKSDNPIIDNFGKICIGGAEEPEVDYLFFGVTKSEDQKELLVGQSLRWNAPQDAHGNFTLTNPDSEFTLGVELKNVTGTFDPAVWDGKTLTKKGLGTLVLATKNSYTGVTNVEAGTLKLTHEQAASGSKEIQLAQSAELNLDFNRIKNETDGSWSNGMETPVTGAGSVTKTGYDSIAVLNSRNTYTGATNVQEGVLLVDGSLDSQVWVREHAGFGGNGTVNNKVTFIDHSHYYWRFSATESESDMLTVKDDVYIGDNVLFTPVPILTKDLLNSFENRKVLNYWSSLNGRFAGIDNSSSAFFDFELDYDQSNYVTISGYLRQEPRPLSDIVATSLMLAQTKMYRTAYQQITREWLSECTDHPSQESVASTFQARGQAKHRPQRTAWMTFVGRGDDFESNYFKEGFNLQSYGVQAGLSFISNCTRSFGLLFGREEGKLSNYSDQVKNEDYYLGLYYGQVFHSNLDIRTYIGGGWQNNNLIRTNNGYRYGSNYDGNTFDLNVEVGRRFKARRDWNVRFFAGADLEVSRIGSSTEHSIDLEKSKEYRQYQRSELTKFITRAGMEVMKNWRRIDFHAGSQLGWNFGDTRPVTNIYYPALEGTGLKTNVVGSGAHLGRFEWGFNVGMNWFLSERRNTLFFLEYNGDIYLDRDGDTSAGGGTVGFSWKF
ncbi:MAG: autotransporter-associated beta strand repeat-containing protein [Planctomycetaceae bacterium]|jgi:autotransporter-associated beta strand protein|nr:autotransporter-associated beta strand repeat-containing protein [Planctomycetaceae bacterium]